MSQTASSRLLTCLLLTASAFLGMAGAAGADAPTPAPLIAIDPGHGGRYSNANANGLKEKNVNLAIALELRRQLVARGYEVVMTRTTDRAVRLSDTRTWNYSTRLKRWYYRQDGRTGYYGGIPRDDLQQRAHIANQAGADLFISIHANGAYSRSARGTETWSSPRDKQGGKLAPVVHQGILARTSLRDRGTFRADFYVCRWTNMPSALVETAFISSPADAYLLKQRWFRRRVAQGIAEGVDAWLAAEPYRQVYPRVGGSTAATLSAQLSRSDFPEGAAVAVIARSDAAADLASAPGLATSLGGPLLWTDASIAGTPPMLASSTAEELARLAPQRLVLTGVAGSFDETAVAMLATAAGLPTSAVEVVSAPDRATLAAAIAALRGPSATGEALIVDVADPAAGLTVAPLAASTGAPLLFAENGSLHPASAEYLAANADAIGRLVLVGSVDQLPASLGAGYSITRVSGADFAQTAAMLNARYFPVASTGTLRPIVASYTSPTSYLTAATRAGRTSQPLAPVTTRTLPAFTREWITNRRPAIASFTIVNKSSMPYLMDAMLAKADKL